MASPPLVTKHLRIVGRVQGVGFRMYFAEEARARGVTGWVRNRRDGSVEATVHGSSDAVRKVVDWARHGPPSARVTDVQVSDASGSFETFEMKPTE